MKKAMGLFLIVAMAAVAGCATTKNGGMDVAHEAKTGFLKDYYGRLEPGPEGGARERWLKPGVEWKKYEKVMLDSVVFFLDGDSEYKGIEPNELKKLADGFNQAFVDSLKDSYPIVTEPGPDVLRLRFAITDLQQSHPVLSGVTTVVPVGLGVSILKKGATGSWTGSGATSAELMAIDSTTNEVIGVAKDERSAGFTKRFTKWGSAEDAFKFWAQRLEAFLNQVHGRQ
ncbi:MAG: DUF3313 domain-containing protein [Desulfobacterales bacterium]